jgi:hypothetical protein
MRGYSEGKSNIDNKAIGNHHFVPFDKAKLTLFPRDYNLNPQAFKEKILIENFTPKELVHREAFIQTPGNMMSSR